MKAKKELELKEKGWNDLEIERAKRILDKSEHQEMFFSKITFWSALIVIIFANLIVSLILIPFLIVFTKTFAMIIVAILALTIGFLYNFLITDLGYLKRKHHIASSIIIPILSLGNMIAMVFVSNRFINEVGAVKNNPQNPWIIGLVFAIAFILPYLFDQLRKKIRK